MQHNKNAQNLIDNIKINQEIKLHRTNQIILNFEFFIQFLKF